MHEYIAASSAGPNFTVTHFSQAKSKSCIVFRGSECSFTRPFLLYSILGCVLPQQAVASARVFQLSLSFAILVHTTPCCPKMSSLQRRLGLPTDLTQSVCHSVLLLVHLLPFIRAMRPANFHFLLYFSNINNWPSHYSSAAT